MQINFDGLPGDSDPCGGLITARGLALPFWSLTELCCSALGQEQIAARHWTDPAQQHWLLFCTANAGL